MTRGTTLLPIERGKAILLITDIPARVCGNCGEPYIEEDTAREVQKLASATFDGTISYGCTSDKREVLVTEFA